MPFSSHADDASDGDGDAQAATRDLFVTETMAELSARQGRRDEAMAIYQRLIARGAPEPQRARWLERLAALEGAQGDPNAAAPVDRRAPPLDRSVAPAPAPAPSSPALQLPLLVRQPVRSGQIVYAEGRDLIVLAPVNPGAQLLADGNIHVYGPLRGRAVAGVRGCLEAQIFCRRLEAELCGIDTAYVPAAELPAELQGQGARVWLEQGRCRFAPL
jgi:septum site-determining protein MinC